VILETATTSTTTMRRQATLTTATATGPPPPTTTTTPSVQALEDKAVDHPDPEGIVVVSENHLRRLGCCIPSRLSSSSSFPTLGLLQFPFDYIFTVNNSSLWQKHVAWAKPDGRELKLYITQSYSSFSVLLSLLLATTTAIFFHSSPEIVELRQHLRSHNLQDLKFWIGFTLLLNIIVALLGLLVTTTAWGMISAIGDNNAHCLLRSTSGSYVTSLPPRFVVASLYLCLTWVVLFVVELVAIWPAMILLGVVALLFFSIVPSLSVFGRLILHTGAMSSQRPVLSEDLEKELLPTGLQSSLLIRAYICRHRNWSFMNQYSRRLRHQQQQEAIHEQSLQRETFDVQEPDWPATEQKPNSFSSGNHDNKDDITDSRHQEQRQNPSRHFYTGSDGTMFASITGGSLSDSDREVSGMNEVAIQNNKDLMKASDYEKMNRASSRDSPSLQPASRRIQPTHIHPVKPPNHHSRTETAETNTNMYLPPAAILNLSMSGKQFKDLINNTIDTSSLGGGQDRWDVDETLPSIDRTNTDGSRAKDHSNNTIPVTAESDTQRGDKNVQENVSTSPKQQSPPRSSPTRNYSRPSILSMSHRTTSAPSFGNATRHHRRGSSSRFILDEWAQESSVRDLYGFEPPAEIIVFDETETDTAGKVLVDEDKQQHQGQPASFFRSLLSTHAMNSENHHYHDNDNTNSSITNSSLLISPFSLSGSWRDNNHIQSQSQTAGRTLMQPLLPHLEDNGGIGNNSNRNTTNEVTQDVVVTDDTDRDAETGLSLLHGEDLLPPDFHRRRTFHTSNHRKGT
jgi:hypothetical protein